MGPGTAVVVGAGSTIGTAVALGLAEAGFALDLWGRDPARLAAAARAVGDPATVREVELADPAAVDAAAAAVAGPVGAVVYAAGLFDWGDADAADPDAWAALMQVNLTA